MTACVLVVDDNPQVRQAIQWALEDEGFAVIAAADGHEALHLLAAGAPDLAVLDFTLPTMDGDELARTLRSSRGAGVPIILITADGQAAAKAERVGAFAYLRKPFAVEELIRAVRTRLSTS
jgi:DNA-binding response OmpR family regulator